MNEIRWRTLILGNSFPEDFNHGNWTSPPGETFPLDIVLGLETKANVYKVIVNANDVRIPSRIDVSVGRTSDNVPVNYKNARDADFSPAVSIDFQRRERSESRMESRIVFTDTVGQYIWLRVHGPHDNGTRMEKQIGISKVTVLGYQEGNGRNERNGDETPNEEGEAADPLTHLRTVRRTIQRQKDDANAKGRDVEATICLRTIQTLNEYEKKIEDLATKRRKSLVFGKFEEAEKLRQTMVDYTDTALRTTTVDILLTRPEALQRRYAQM